MGVREVRFFNVGAEWGPKALGERFKFWNAFCWESGTGMFVIGSGEIL